MSNRLSNSGQKLFAVIVCDSQAKWGGPHGISQRIQDLMAEDGEQWKTFVAEQGDFPSEEELERFTGIYITGSKHSVNDQSQPWIKQLEVLIQRARALKRPKVFGTCFGHQAISKALGGRVAKNPGKTFICHNEKITLTGSENDSSFLNDVRKISETKALRMLQSHGECVEELPTNARSVASSESCDHEIVLYSDNVIGIQSHPDFNTADLSEVIIPSLLERKIITKEECDEANQSFEIPNACSDIAVAVRDFLKS